MKKVWILLPICLVLMTTTASAISVAPAMNTLEFTKLKSISYPISITNTEPVTTTMTIIIQDPEKVTYGTVEDDTIILPREYWQYITISDNSIDIPPNETRTITVTINLPPDDAIYNNKFIIRILITEQSSGNIGLRVSHKLYIITPDKPTEAAIPLMPLLLIGGGILLAFACFYYRRNLKNLFKSRKPKPLKTSTIPLPTYTPAPKETNPFEKIDNNVTPYRKRRSRLEMRYERERNK